MNLADMLRLVLIAIIAVALPFSLWATANKIAAWRYERRRLRLVSPKRPAVDIRFDRRVS